MTVFTGFVSSFIQKVYHLSFFLILSITATAQTNTSDLLIGISSNVNIANVGDNVVFTINIKNNGPNTANNTKITDVLPSGYTLVSANPSRGTWTDPIWYVGSLAVNATASIAITAKVNPYGNYTNTVTIKADEPDQNLADNSAKINIGVIRAIDDYAYVNETFAGAAINNILANDFYNGSFALISKVNIEQISSSNPNLSINVSTGEVVVSNLLSVGNYSLVYKISDKANPALFSTANIYINVNKNNGGIVDAPISAEHDAGQAPEITGGIAVFNVLANDKLLGKQATLSNVNLEFLSSTDPNITLDLATGKVLVAPNTPGGPYILNYKITDKVDATINATTYVTVNVVGTGRLDTKDDFGIIDSSNGGVAVDNVLANDLNNGAVIQIGDVLLSRLFRSNDHIDIDTNTGKVIVDPGLPNGFYTLTYQVVDKSDPTNKGAADVIIEVTGGVNIIQANEDRGIVNGTTGGIAVANILENDNLKGAVPTLADVYIFQTFSNNSAINLDFNTGRVVVNPGTYNGFYTVTYQIQEKADLSNVSLADIIVEVQGGLSLLTAKEDAGSASGIVGGVAVENVLANDDLEGLTPTLNEVNITQIFTNNPGISLDENTGQVIVAPGTENGVYTLAYYVEDKNKPESSSYADVIVSVTLENVNILANPDVGSANGITGGVAIENILANDILAGNLPLITDVNLVLVSTTHPGVNLDINTGKVVVSAGTPNGVYTLKYSIEDKANLGDISSANVTVTVNSGVSVILAVEDRGIVNTVTGGIAVANILANDVLNGKAPLLSEVEILQLFTSDPTNVNIDITTGQATVAPGTPIGFYTITYQIEDRLNPGILSVVDVIIEVTDIISPIAASDDYGDSSFPNGGIAVQNVLSNDLINGSIATLANVDLTLVSSSHAGVSLDLSTAKVNVAPNTPTGDYTLTYKIADKSDLTKETTATVFVSVVSLLPIAMNDAGSVNSIVGGTAVNNVLVNDVFKNKPVNIDDIILSAVSSTHPNITLNAVNGRVSVAPNTPAGSYTLVYQIANKLNSNSFSLASVIINVILPNIIASDDAGAVDGLVGGVAVLNILKNDDFNGAAALITNITLTQTTVDANISINPTTGAVNVAAGTAAGIYTVNYRITDKVNPTNFSNAKVIVTVGSSLAPITTTNDVGSINGFVGGTAIANVLANDTYNGSTALATNVTLEQVTANPNISINPTTGAVTVAAGTAAGIYTIVYKITDKLTPTNAKTADAVVTVSAPVIIATNDAGSINGFVGGTAIVNVLANDIYNGSTALSANLTLEQVTINPNISINPNTGAVTVAAGTAAGVYTITYKITDKLNPTNAKTADAVVTVSAPVIIATNDAGNINGFIGGTAIINVLANDTYNGSTALPANVNLEQVTANPNISINPTTGAVTVAAGTAAGVYNITYKITDKLNPTNAKTANAVVTVSAPVIIAANDAGSINGFVGGTAIPNVLANDTYNGSTALPANVNLEQVTANPNISINPTTGAVTVAAGTAAGVYTITYKITDKLNPTNAKTADAVVTVSAPVIIATNDAGSINGFVGGTAIVNVLANDTYNGSTALPANVNLEQVTANPNISINPTTGAVTVAAGTAAGVYTITYKITDKLNPTNAKTADAVVTVSAPVIIATNDAGNINGFVGGTAIINVLANDTYIGSTALPANVILEQVTTNPNININPTTGAVTVAAGTAAGVYTITYKITDKLNPTNAKTADAVVTVSAPGIIATNDTGSINGFVGGTAIANVLANDTYNGSTALPANVNLEQVTANPNISINPTTGAVTVAAGTAAGIYTIVYKITDKLNPINAKTADAVVTVSAPVIIASNDAGSINGFVGGTAIANVLANDTYNGSTALPANVTLEQVTINPNISINPNTGAVTVAAGTAAGVYTITYKITDKLNPTNAKAADAVVTVKPQSILATDDIKIIDGKSTIVAIDNIVANDFLNDQLTNLNNVSITNVVSVSPNIVVNTTTGSVTVDKAILAGTYVISYTIQDKINATLTSSATITITVSPNPIIGLAKAVSAVNKELDGSYTLNYTLHIKNYGNTSLTNVKVTDDLVKTFPLPISFSIVGNINTSGSLQANSNFNGSSNIELLNTASILAPNQKESISFSVNVRLNNTTDTLFYNRALVSANSLGGSVSDESTNGLEPDINSDGNPDENIATPIVLNKAGIRIPQGFSPNNDGVHDQFVIENTVGDTISLEIFNRWGNVVYKNENYKNDWSGKSNQGITIGEDLPDGTYYYIVIVNGKDKYVKYLTIKR